MKIMLTRITLCLILCINTCLISTLAHPAQDKTSADVETTVYKKWYIAFKERNLPEAIKLGDAYLEAFPNGQYGGYIREIITFARISLDKEKVAQANRQRAIIRSNLAEDAPQLKALLTDTLNGHVDVNTTNKKGLTALMFAAATGNAEAVEALLQKDANLDITEGSYGWTALVYAIWSGDKSTVRNLLDYYPDVNIKDKEGRTALDHAILTADFEMMSLETVS
jgi:hypothetical protein